MDSDSDNERLLHLLNSHCSEALGDSVLEKNEARPARKRRRLEPTLQASEPLDDDNDELFEEWHGINKHIESDSDDEKHGMQRLYRLRCLY